MKLHGAFNPCIFFELFRISISSSFEVRLSRSELNELQTQATNGMRSPENWRFWYGRRMNLEDYVLYQDVVFKDVVDVMILTSSNIVSASKRLPKTIAFACASRHHFVSKVSNWCVYLLEIESHTFWFGRLNKARISYARLQVVPRKVPRAGRCYDDILL